MSIYRDILDRLQPLQPVPTQLSRKIRAFPECKAVLFDIYGTLLISASGDIGHTKMQTNAVEQAFRQAITNSHPTDTTRVLAGYQTFIDQKHEVLKRRGIPYPEVDIQQIWQQLWAELGFTADASMSRQADLNRLALAFECQINPVWPMPHFKPTLQRLMESALHLGIISNAQFYTPILVNYFLGHPEENGDRIKGFEPSLISYSWKIGRAKPDTWAFSQCLKTLGKLNIQPSEVLFVGNDKLNDIYPAHLVGMKTCLFAGDQRSLRLREDDDRVRDLEPTFIIDDLQQLLDIILSSRTTVND